MIGLGDVVVVDCCVLDCCFGCLFVVFVLVGVGGGVLFFLFCVVGGVVGGVVVVGLVVC